MKHATYHEGGESAASPLFKQPSRATAAVRRPWPWRWTVADGLHRCRRLREVVGSAVPVVVVSVDHDGARWFHGAQSANPGAGDGLPDDLPTRSSAERNRAHRLRRVARAFHGVHAGVPRAVRTARDGVAAARRGVLGSATTPCHGARGPNAAWRLNRRATDGEEDATMEAWVIVVCLLVVVLALYNTTMKDTRRR